MKSFYLIIFVLVLTGCEQLKGINPAVAATGAAHVRADTHLASAEDQLTDAEKKTDGEAQWLVQGAHHNVTAARGDVRDAATSSDQVAQQLQKTQDSYQHLYDTRWNRLGRLLASIAKWLIAAVSIGFAALVVGNLVTGGWAAVFASIGHLGFGLLTLIPSIARGVAGGIRGFAAMFSLFRDPPTDSR